MYGRLCSLRECFNLAAEALVNSAANLVAQIEDTRVGDGVNDRDPFSLTSEHAGIRQGLKMAGDIRLSEAGGLDEFADVFFASLQGDDELETVGLAKSFEAGGDEFEGLVREVLRR